VSKKLEQVFENMTIRGSPRNRSKKNDSSTNLDEWNSSVHRSPSPISGSMDKINKLRGIGNFEKNEKVNFERKESTIHQEQTLFASRNYLIQGKSFVFQ